MACAKWAGPVLRRAGRACVVGGGGWWCALGLCAATRSRHGVRLGPRRQLADASSLSALKDRSHSRRVDGKSS